MKKRSVKQKAIERAKWSETFKDGFNHGYDMGYKQGIREAEGSGSIDNRVDKLDRQNNQVEAWEH